MNFISSLRRSPPLPIPSLCQPPAPVLGLFHRNPMFGLYRESGVRTFFVFLPRVGKCGRPCGRAGQRGRIQEVVVESGGGCRWVPDCNLSLWAMPPATCHKKVYHPKVRCLFQQFLFCSQSPVMHRWQPRHVLQL